ncbi:MAG: hypothetical protein GQ574_07705 [Crocinitomix sp.]|nr:hypothetical protein [Crocinitomix sp.]
MLTINPSRILVLLIALIFLSCQVASEDGITYRLDEEAGYDLIRDDLYEDGEGNLYFRTIDKSAISDDSEDPEKWYMYVFNDYLYVDSLVSKHIGITTAELKDVVDAQTFHKADRKDPAEGIVPSPLTRSFYADKNNTYFLMHVADGGVLHKE